MPEPCMSTARSDTVPYRYWFTVQGTTLSPIDLQESPKMCAVCGSGMYGVILHPRKFYCLRCGPEMADESNADGAIWGKGPGGVTT